MLERAVGRRHGDVHGQGDDRPRRPRGRPRRRAGAGRDDDGWCRRHEPIASTRAARSRPDAGDRRWRSRPSDRWHRLFIAFVTVGHPARLVPRDPRGDHASRSSSSTTCAVPTTTCCRVQAQVLARNTSSDTTYCIEITVDRRRPRRARASRTVVAEPTTGDGELGPGRSANFVAVFDELTAAADRRGARRLLRLRHPRRALLTRRDGDCVTHRPTLASAARRVYSSLGNHHETGGGTVIRTRSRLAGTSIAVLVARCRQLRRRR